MPAMILNLDATQTPFAALRHIPGEDWQPAIDRGDVIWLGGDTSFEVGGIPAGMQSGAASVAFVIPLPNGPIVVAETSLRLFTAAARALEARYPDSAG